MLLIFVNIIKRCWFLIFPQGWPIFFHSLKEKKKEKTQKNKQKLRETIQILEHGGKYEKYLKIKIKL